MTADTPTPTAPETDELEKLLAAATKGPWQAASGHVQKGGKLYWQIEDGMDAIMQNQFCWTQGDAEANARLIALTPTLAADLIRLRAEVATLTASEEGAHMTIATVIGERDAARAEVATLRASEARMREAVRYAHDKLWELNPSNYDHDEVCKANDAAVEVILTLAPLLGETHGKTPEWWAARAALQGETK
jgi:hypothetical protein